MAGGNSWIHDSIADESLVAVTDGSYIRELYPNLCSAVFVMECSKGRGRIVGSFSESLSAANAYRGELLGLMAIHLILLSTNKLHRDLSGKVEVVSDCLGALQRVSTLPPYRIPSRCRHSDILKTILVHCRGLSFTTLYVHIKAHQDDNKSFAQLSRKAQLNCICDQGAKQRIAIDGAEGSALSRMFPLEPVGMFVGGEKMTSDTGGKIRFWAHHQLARKYYKDHNILSPLQFDLVDWQSVHRTLHDLPRLFQVWAAKHILNIAGTMKFLSYQDNRSPMCPSCNCCVESCAHVGRCSEEGRAMAFEQSAQMMEQWLARTGPIRTYSPSFFGTCQAGATYLATNAPRIQTSPTSYRNSQHRRTSSAGTDSLWGWSRQNFSQFKALTYTNVITLIRQQGGYRG